MSARANVCTAPILSAIPDRGSLKRFLITVAGMVKQGCGFPKRLNDDEIIPLHLVKPLEDLHDDATSRLCRDPYALWGRLHHRPCLLRRRSDPGRRRAGAAGGFFIFEHKDIGNDIFIYYGSRSLFACFYYIGIYCVLITFICYYWGKKFWQIAKSYRWLYVCPCDFVLEIIFYFCYPSRR